MIVEENGQFLEYPSTKINRELISELQWMDVNDVFELVHYILTSQNIQPVIIDPQDLIIKYPSCKQQILPYLRDKKIDDVF